MMKKIKVVVGMSGGVDSSVAAAKLVRDGFDVLGMHLKLWSETGENRCCSLADEEDARLVAAKLGVPFYVYDLSKEFKKIVVDYFLDEYKNGRTPNPCMLCNREIRFGLMLKKAKELGADFLATGHYARIISNDGFQLLRGKDKNKDQSYMLAFVRPEDLKYAMFPLGDFTKADVRRMAKKWGIKTAEKRDSQEVCFAANNYRDFLLRRIAKDIKAGDIIDLRGHIIGRHLGLPMYTIGQRRGIEVGKHLTENGRLFGKPKMEMQPFYVVGMDVKKNRLIVGREKDLYKKEMVVEKVNWILNSPKFPFSCKVQIRYKHEAVSCKVEAVFPQCLKVLFAKPQRAVTPGQSAVFYRGNEVLGGGIIK
jgi:tRNA-specific 2-thiouridylase